MFGKLSILGNYLITSLNIYVVRRYPSNKLPLFSMVFSYYILYRIANNQMNKKRAYYLQTLRGNEDWGDSCPKARRINKCLK